MAGWEPLASIIRLEVQQRFEEGYDTAGFKERVEAAGDNEAALMKLYEELAMLPVREDFPYEEPSDYADIVAQRPGVSRRLPDSLSGSQWQDKFRGAWLGRAAGCALGKPLESWPFMSGRDGTPGWRNVQLWFEGADQWPIRHYTPMNSSAEAAFGLSLHSDASCRENIAYMESDDDIRYTVLGLIMLEEKGLYFDGWDVGKLWHSKLTYSQVCTAETQAYMNFAQVTSHIRGQRPADWETSGQERVRTYLNPYREWIGAQIRVDGYAYGAAGRPELAARLAYQDASFSHVKNGIYGAMFCAAMIAAAFVESDPKRIVEIGLEQIPKRSRLAADIALAVRIAEESASQLELVSRIWDAFNHYHPVHTNNNAALCAAALIHAQGDFEKGITTAVLGGWDTDCNGATVGSILGASLGASRLPASWTDPLHDKLYAEVTGFHPIAISECANRSYAIHQKLNRS